MAGVNVKLGISGVSDFKRGMKDAESSVKTLESALKLNEEALKSNGDQEQYLKNKVQILKDAFEKQKDAVDNVEKALDSMRRNGIDQNSAAFQTMQKHSYDAQRKLLEMKDALNNVGTEAVNANTGLESIGKNISWDNVSDSDGGIYADIFC